MGHGHMVLSVEKDNPALWFMILAWCSLAMSPFPAVSVDLSAASVQGKIFLDSILRGIFNQPVSIGCDLLLKACGAMHLSLNARWASVKARPKGSQTLITYGFDTTWLPQWDKYLAGAPQLQLLAFCEVYLKVECKGGEKFGFMIIGFDCAKF